MECKWVHVFDVRAFEYFSCSVRTLLFDKIHFALVGLIRKYRIHSNFMIIYPLIHCQCDHKIEILSNSNVKPTKTKSLRISASWWSEQWRMKACGKDKQRENACITWETIFYVRLTLNRLIRTNDTLRYNDRQKQWVGMHDCIAHASILLRTKCGNICLWA